MRIDHSLKHAGLPVLFLALSIFSVALVTAIRPASAAPTGTFFDHIVIIAMENSAYSSVFGTGTVASCPTASAPFLCSMLPLSATLPSMNNYGATAADTNDFNGCSAACYVGLMAGYTYGVSDGYGSLTASNLVADRIASSGLTWQAYCESGCPRGNDHFPFTSFTDTSSSSNIFAGSSVSTSTFITAANSANPPNFLWFTPTDSHNMHDVSVSVGDSYLQSFLVGTGSIASPASGSLLASSVFTNPSYHTLLYLWWDECGGSNGSCDSNNDAPNLFYGTPVKKGYVSPDTTGIDEYASLWTIENNWGFAPIAQGDTAAKSGGYILNDIFAPTGPTPLSASFIFSPSSLTTRTLASFTATANGGTGPYQYSWSFGDGSTGTGAIATHTYASVGSYNTTLTVTDSASKTAKSSQVLQVSPIPTLSASFTYSPSQPASGQTVTYSASATGGVPGYTYNWNFGDGSSGTGQSPSHTYSSSGSFTTKLNVTDSIGTLATTSQTITVSPPAPLAASFVTSPNSPTTGQTVTFTATATGGTGPYAYSWNLGGTTKTGNQVSQSFTNGTYTIALTVTDSASHTATSSRSLTVLPSSQGSTVPVLVGWGGVRMDESVAGTSGNLSAVFSGEYASNMEVVVIRMKAMGYNTVRVDFDPYCTDMADYNYMSVYSQTNAQRAVQIAQHYGFWIVIDYHGYSDIFRNTSCWLSYWKPIVQNIGPLYSQIIWEPENEPTLDCTNSPSSCPAAPCSSDASCVVYLSSAYQQWINQTRALGDNHWIAVQNLCSYACGLSDMSQGYPTVIDPLGTLSQGGRIFISLHSYMDYNQYSSSWTNATAVSAATAYYQAVVTGVANTGWPALNTEGGTDPLSCDPNICTPDIVLNGSAGYSVVTFHFIQTLVSLYDSSAPQRINWIWWPVGSWTNTPGAGVYGALQCNSNPIGWGCLLSFAALGPPPATFSITGSSPSPADVGQSASSTITTTALNGFVGSVILMLSPTSGLSCQNPSPPRIIGSGSATVSCTASNAGSYPLTVSGTSGTIVQSTIIIFNFQDFTVSAANPAPLQPGSSETSSLTFNSLNGFSGTISISDSTPAGLTCGTITPASISGSGTATISCVSNSQNVYTLTITATSGPITHTATATLTFGTPPDFLITASSPLPTTAGSSVTVTVAIALVNGLTGPVTLTDAAPAGLSCSPISTSTFTTNGSATLSCSSVSASTYTLTVTGATGALSHAATTTLSFEDFSLSANPTNLTITTGGQASSTISLNALNGFGSTVALSVSSSTGVLSSTSITGSTASTLTISPTTMGTYRIVLTGTSGSLSHTVSLTVTVVSSNTLPILTVPGALNATVGGNLHFIVTATDPTGKGGAIVLSATGLASGMTFNPSTGTFSFTPTTAQAGQTFTVTFTATDTNDPTWTSTQSVPIHVQPVTSQPSSGGFCLSCLLPRSLTTTAWIVAIGALLGVVSSLALLHFRASAQLRASRRRLELNSARTPSARSKGQYQTTRNSDPRVRRREPAANSE